ncbi:MAG TPA: hypothetical protein PLP19_16980 [bacterium]|nr:hypothetical protein [bacterium]HPN45189.1 hypothetical protein [bacterium]
MNNKHEKNFDAVAMMRKIRDDLVKKYTADPQAETNDLINIRKKYNIQLIESAKTETMK